MLAGRYESSQTRVQPFFEQLFRRDGAGGSWLSTLLGATPHGHERLGELIDAPGWLQTQLAVPTTATGRLGCFEYPVSAPKRLLAWYIDHPDELVWPPDGEASPDTVRLRRALIDDEPPGSQPRARERARALLAKRSALSSEWWRLEEMSTLDCVLITERLVVTVEAERAGGIAPATPWYPQRSRLIRDLEGARHLADGKRWATLVLSERPLAAAEDQRVERSLAQGAPHLDAGELRELHHAYLGNLTWSDACTALGIAPGSLSPDPVGEPPAA